jgi:RNA polymerase sigma-70 factor (ECF subfamily)
VSILARDSAISAVQDVYRAESRRVLATLIRLIGDFDAAEEALQDALRAALEEWPERGVPANPRAWLVSAGRFKAIDAIRKRAKLELGDVPEHAVVLDESSLDEAHVVDDQLRLIFTCCHPALASDAQVALTLREMCGLTTEAIAHAFVLPVATLAQRIVRAKAKIKSERIPYEVPARDQLAGRVDAVLRVIYLVFREGYSASSGEALVRKELSSEAIRLGRLLIELMPEPEAEGLLALMLLHESRRAARVSGSGDLILLGEQDRALWEAALIGEGCALVERALRSRRFGSYALQAAIAAVHAEAKRAEETDWHQIVGLYALLLRVEPTPIVELNRAVAIAMCDGPEAGLEKIDAILARGELAAYHLAHSARADLCRRLERYEEARASYTRALELAEQEPVRRFLQRRLSELPG